MHRVPNQGGFEKMKGITKTMFAVLAAFIMVSCGFIAIIGNSSDETTAVKETDWAADESISFNNKIDIKIVDPGKYYDKYDLINTASNKYVLTVANPGEATSDASADAIFNAKGAKYIISERADYYNAYNTATYSLFTIMNYDANATVYYWAVNDLPNESKWKQLEGMDGFYASKDAVTLDHSSAVSVTMLPVAYNDTNKDNIIRTGVNTYDISLTDDGYVKLYLDSTQINTKNGVKKPFIVTEKIYDEQPGESIYKAYRLSMFDKPALTLENTSENTHEFIEYYPGLTQTKIWIVSDTALTTTDGWTGTGDVYQRAVDDTTPAALTGAQYLEFNYVPKIIGDNGSNPLKYNVIHHGSSTADGEIYYVGGINSTTDTAPLSVEGNANYSGIYVISKRTDCYNAYPISLFSSDKLAFILSEEEVSYWFVNADSVSNANVWKAATGSNYKYATLTDGAALVAKHNDTKVTLEFKPAPTGITWNSDNSYTPATQSNLDYLIEYNLTKKLSFNKFTLTKDVEIPSGDTWTVNDTVTITNSATITAYGKLLNNGAILGDGCVFVKSNETKQGTGTYLVNLIVLKNKDSGAASLETIAFAKDGKEIIIGITESETTLTHVNFNGVIEICYSYYDSRGNLCLNGHKFASLNGLSSETTNDTISETKTVIVDFDVPIVVCEVCYHYLISETLIELQTPWETAVASL